MLKKRDPLLSRMSAYRRLAQKARRAHQTRQADHYTKLADNLYSQYQRQKSFLEKLKRGA